MYTYETITQGVHEGEHTLAMTTDGLLVKSPDQDRFLTFPG